MKFNSQCYEFLLEGSKETIENGKSVLLEMGINANEATENLLYQIGKNPNDKELRSHVIELYIQSQNTGS